MASLSRIVKEKKKMTRIKIPTVEIKRDEDLQKPEFVVAKPIATATVTPVATGVATVTPTVTPTVTSIADFKEPDFRESNWDLEEIEDEANEWDHILFIADCKLSKKVRDYLGNEYNDITQFDNDLFKNRCPNQLVENHKVKHIWINLRSKLAREWLIEYLKVSDPFKTVSVCSVKNSKWVADIEKFTDISCSIKEIKNLKNLCHRDFKEKLDGLGIRLHPPANQFLACLGLSKNVLTKKKGRNS